MSNDPEQRAISNGEIVDILRQFDRLTDCFCDPTPEGGFPNYKRRHRELDVAEKGARFVLAGVRYHLYEYEITDRSKPFDSLYPTFAQYTIEWLDTKSVVQIDDIKTATTHTGHIQIIGDGVTARHHELPGQIHNDGSFEPIYSEDEQRALRLIRLFFADEISSYSFRIGMAEIDEAIRQVEEAFGRNTRTFTAEHCKFLMQRLPFLEANYLDPDQTV